MKEVTGYKEGNLDGAFIIKFNYEQQKTPRSVDLGAFASLTEKVSHDILSLRKLRKIIIRYGIEEFYDIK